MKNYNEIANKIFQRRDMYIAGQKKKRKNVVRLTAVLCSFALIVLMAIGVIQSGMLSVYNDNTINSIDNITPNLMATLTPTDKITATPTPELVATPTPTDKVMTTPTPKLVATPIPTDKVTATPTPKLVATPIPTDKVMTTPTPKLVATPTPIDKVTATPTPELVASLHKKRFNTVEELVAYAKTQPRWENYAFIPMLKNIENKFIICEILANETYVWISYVDTSSENINFPVCLQIGMMTTTDYNGYLGWAKNVIGGTETVINGKATVVRKNSFLFRDEMMTETYYFFNEGNVEMSIRVPQWATSLGTPEYFTDLEHVFFQ